MDENMGYSRQLLSMCVDAMRGGMDDDQQKALTSQIVGAFAAMPVVGRNIVTLANNRDWNGLIGAIGSYIDVQEAGRHSTSINVASSAVARTNVSMRQHFNASFRAIERADGIEENVKERLEELLSAIEQSATSHNPKSFAKNVAEWMGLAADSSTVITACAPFIGKLFDLFTS